MLGGFASLSLVHTCLTFLNGGAPESICLSWWETPFFRARVSEVETPGVFLETASCEEETRDVQGAWRGDLVCGGQAKLS